MSAQQNAEQAGGSRKKIFQHPDRFIKILEKINIFKGLSMPQFRKILYICSQTTFSADDVLCIAGDPSYEFFIVIKGDLVVTSASGEFITRITPVGIVGEMGIFTGELRSATVTAETDCLSLVIRRNELLRLLSQDTNMGVKVLLNVIHELAAKIRKDNEIIEGLKQGGQFTEKAKKDSLSDVLDTNNDDLI